MADWWNELLESRHEDGRKDADRGLFNRPYAGNVDPQNEDENEAYKRGFDERRKELGDKFEWA